MDQLSRLIAQVSAIGCAVEQCIACLEFEELGISDRAYLFTIALMRAGKYDNAETVINTLSDTSDQMLHIYLEFQLQNIEAIRKFEYQYPVIQTDRILALSTLFIQANDSLIGSGLTRQHELTIIQNLALLILGVNLIYGGVNPVPAELSTHSDPKIAYYFTNYILLRNCIRGNCTLIQ